MQPRLVSNSTAILLAGAMLALAVFFGLRGLAPPAAPSPPPPPTAEPPPPAAEPPPPALDPEVARQRVADALAYHHDKLRQDCYLPAVAGESPLPTLTFEFNYTFDSEGMQIARGVVEVGDTGRPAVTECVLATLPALRIRRPGRVVTATVPLSFP